MELNETDGVLRKRANVPFVPAFVRYDKKTLTFYGYFCEQIDPKDNFFGEGSQRFRYLNVYYHLENDTMSAIEPKTQNSGLMQGKLLRRSKVLKTTECRTKATIEEHGRQEYWHWTDLRFGLEMILNGLRIRLIECDSFTKKFFESHDIDLGASEAIPIDGNSAAATAALPVHNKRKFDDKFLRLLEFNDDKLSFLAIWDDPRTQQRNHFELYYFLADGTITLKDRNPLPIGSTAKETSSFPLFLRRQKLPKNRTGDTEPDHFYGPEDFRIGHTVNVFGRELLIYECSEWTRNFYRERFDREQPQRLDVGSDTTEPDCLHQVSNESPKKLTNISDEQQYAGRIRKLFGNSPDILRYGLAMDARTFVLSYRLSDGRIQICETFDTLRRPERFLHYCYVRGPVRFYEPDDFRVGNDLMVFGRHFRITSVDLFVWHFIERNMDKFSHETYENIREYFRANDTNC